MRLIVHYPGSRVSKIQYCIFNYLCHDKSSPVRWISAVWSGQFSVASQQNREESLRSRFMWLCQHHDGISSCGYLRIYEIICDNSPLWKSVRSRNLNVSQTSTVTAEVIHIQLNGGKFEKFTEETGHVYSY